MSETEHNELGEAEGNPGEEGGEYVAPPPAANRGPVILGGLVLAGVAAIYLMYLRSGPATAGASASPESATAQATITAFLDQGGESLRLMERTLADTEKVVAQFKNYPNAAQVPLADLRTNPFRQFLPEAAAPALRPDENRKRREDERVAVLKAVQGLQLQSILHGENRRACMINNGLYQEGQQVDGFAIENIGPQGVTVKQGAYRFELRMQR